MIAVLLAVLLRPAPTWMDATAQHSAAREAMRVTHPPGEWHQPAARDRVVRPRRRRPVARKVRR